MTLPMNIPNATLSATQFRTYGAGGFRLDAQEGEKGCPRWYHAKYVEGLPVEAASYPLDYGRLFHEVLYLMEQEAIGPDEALQRAWLPHLPQEMWTEARADLDKYLSRAATPFDRYGTLGVELDLRALLYEDEEYGPIWFRGKIDWLGVDLDEPDVLHSVDYKSNRQPPQPSDLDGDVQMRGYDWLIRQNAETWMPGGARRIVTHYDAVKWREVSTSYSDEQIEDWHSWAVAVARQILREREFAPRLNAGCPTCPIRATCPAFQGLPEVGEEAVKHIGSIPAMGLADLVEWRDRTNALRLLLEKGTKDADARIADLVVAEGGSATVAGSAFEVEFPTKVEIDTRRLHDALGDKFYDAVSTSRAAIGRVYKGWEADPDVQACLVEVAQPSKVKRKKA